MLCDAALLVSEEICERDHVGLHAEVESLRKPERGEAVGDGGCVKKLSCRGHSADFGHHLEKARRVLVGVALGNLVDVHHRLVKLLLALSSHERTVVDRGEPELDAGNGMATRAVVDSEEPASLRRIGVP